MFNPADIVGYTYGAYKDLPDTWRKLLMSRYFFSRRKDGTYHIIDRQLDVRIAKADFREAAQLIVNSLNQYEEAKNAKCNVPAAIA